MKNTKSVLRKSSIGQNKTKMKTTKTKNTANAHERVVKGVGQIAIAGVLLALLVGIAFIIVNAQGQDDRNGGISSVEILSDTEPAVVDNTTKKVSENAKKALKHIAKTHSISEEHLEIVNEGQATFSLTKQKLWAGKVLDKNSGEIYGSYLDENGNIVDSKKAKEKENKAHNDKYGKLEPALYEQLRDKDSDEKIKVGIWLTPIDSEKIEMDVLLKHPSVKTIKGRVMLSKDEKDNKGNLVGEEAKKIKDEIFEEKKKAYKAKEKPLIDDLEKKGFDVDYASIAAPLVFANLTKKEILALEKRKDVNGVYLSRIYEPELDTVSPTIRAPYVWGKGYDGSAVKVAIVETGRVDFNHPNLAHAQGWPSAFRPSGGIGDHATQCAGIMASNHNIYKGVAPDVDILSANAASWSDGDLVAASDWALENGADVLSCSFGVGATPDLVALDKYYDNVIWEHYRAVVKSAGNRGGSGCSGDDGAITSPGLAYNVITVGGTNDENTQEWKDDGRYLCSSYVDPVSPHNDRNKPEVSAVAENVNSTTTGNGWRTGSGTSYAAPVVAGEIALLIDRYGNLRDWPEVTKAIVMATAVHDTYTGPIRGNYDDQEGVGTVVASHAYNIYFWEGTTETATTLPKDKYLNVNAGEKVRFVITWDSHTWKTLWWWNDELKADLDLTIYDPNGNSVGGSYTWDNNYEVVEFTAPVTGNYRARINDYRFDDSYEYLGVAWSKRPAPHTFTGSVFQGQDSTQHGFIVPEGTADMFVSLIMPSGTDFDLSVWDNLNRRTGGWTSTDYSTKKDILNSAYSEYWADPEWVWVSPPIANTDMVWKTGTYAYYGSETYTIKVEMT